MLTEDQLIGYIEGALAEEERVRVEAALAEDPVLRRRVVEQVRMEAALRANLGGAGAAERVKQSVLAVLRAESEENLKQQVLRDTTVSRRRPHWLRALRQGFNNRLRLSTGLGLGAVAALALVFWLFVAGPDHGTPLQALIELPGIIELPAGSEIVRNGRSQPSSGRVTIRIGDELRVDPRGSASIVFADGTVLHLEPGSRVVWDADVQRQRAGKQLRLQAGTLSAAVTEQPLNLPLLVHTPHATISVLGTEFDLAVGTNATELEVTRGLVQMADSYTTARVAVAAGERAVASPSEAPRPIRLARHPYVWPFSSSSPWNTPLGDGAEYRPVPGRAFTADGPLTNSLLSRRPFLGGPAHPLRGIWVGGERRADVRLDRVTSLPNARREPVVLLQSGRRHAYELLNVTARADGDLEAEAITRLDLTGPGVFPAPAGAVSWGLSGLGGLLRVGELENGIRHALAARVDRGRLGGRVQFAIPSTVWPAVGGEVSTDELLNVGTLLALPPDLDLAAVVGGAGPGFELARALQDYGVYVTGAGSARFMLLAEGGGVGRQELEGWMNRLVPLLQVVVNNTAQTPGGGGQPRRPRAPMLPGEQN